MFCQIAGQTGHHVTLVDLNQPILAKAENRIYESLKRVAKKTFKDSPGEGERFVADSLTNIKFATNPGESLAQADIVVEAITEVLPLKQKLFKKWEGMCPEQTILATNTSFLKVSDVMRDVERKDRCGGLHFFNPVPVMKLVEVVRMLETSDPTYEALVTFSKDIGKKPVSCKASKFDKKKSLYAHHSASGHPWLHCQPSAGSVCPGRHSYG